MRPVMAESVAAPSVASHSVVVRDTPRHSALVRVTHWINALSFIALVLSGIAILLAHPRLYWGETGAVGAPSLIDLPLPFVLDIPIRDVLLLAPSVHDRDGTGRPIVDCFCRCLDLGTELRLEVPAW